mgnify:FL=1
MAKKISKDEFLSRFNFRYPQAKVEILEYTSISRPATIKCLRCGKILNRQKARQFLNGFDCCGAHDETRLQKVYRMYENSDFTIVKVIDKDYVIVRHSVCGCECHRALNACLDNPFACTNCDTQKTNNMLSIEDAKAQLDSLFEGQIELLEYKGQLEQNYYRCKKCGKIFKRKQVCMMTSKGCPSCDKKKSFGEKLMGQILNDNHIIFEEQFVAPDFPHQRFDFVVFDKNKQIQYFIEVQGEQHFKPVEIWGGEKGLQRQQARDNKKREYCKRMGIPLYEIISEKQQLLNLDILPFQGSTTISVKESTSRNRGEGNGSCLEIG